MIKFKYSLTLAIQKKGAPFFFLPLIVIFCLLFNLINPFDHQTDSFLYYGLNSLGGLLGYGMGVLFWLSTYTWMRKHTIWSGDWEKFDK